MLSVLRYLLVLYGPAESDKDAVIPTLAEFLRIHQKELWAFFPATSGHELSESWFIGTDEAFTSYPRP